MRFIFLIFLFVGSFCQASIDLGVGASSFTTGRPAPALAIGLDNGSWGALYRSSGVQTTIYAQNAWTVAGFKIVYSENLGITHPSIGVGLGATYINRSYRRSLTSDIESYGESVLGPHFYLKIQLGPAYLGFDTLLGLTSNIVQHLVLNFQDVSHITVGFAL